MLEIEACCMDCVEDDLAGVTAAVIESLEHAKAIDGIFTDRVGTAGPDFKNLLSDIYELKKFLELQLAKRRPGESTEEGSADGEADGGSGGTGRSEENTSELQSLMRISYAVFCLKKKKTTNNRHRIDT